ncbi:type II toxin-antitoxin system PemK/MazF family toxin [Microbacterium luticocti]|uniref:type II toxin-antitoxin system PemK/MazF family toxin n=1 Tax=Microbacterium luticocti TaxID=451764 RepID=UPI0003FEF84C|nr:type II toxin-antitoxin system PemK/MazF family toxin [Microbacterium luticocti]
MRTGILSRLFDLLRPASRGTSGHRPVPPGAGGAEAFPESPGSTGTAATVEIDPPGPAELRIGYAPRPDGDPDAGEIVWTWVPYEEHDGRGKDRPVLVIGRRDLTRVYAVKLTSKAHDSDHDYLSIGPGPWDSKGRPSWVDIDQVYLVHHDGMRREAATLDRERFDVVADALRRRYGWARG